MSQLLSPVDPRPLEPDWVFDIIVDDPGKLEWEIQFTDKIEAGNSMEELFQKLALLLLQEKEASVSVDATSLEPLVEFPTYGHWIARKVRINDYTHMHHIASIDDVIEEEGSSNSALLDFIELSIYRSKSIKVEIDNEGRLG